MSYRNSSPTNSSISYSSDLTCEISLFPKGKEESPKQINRTVIKAMALVGCPRCFLYVMTSEEDPNCPKCNSTTSFLDVFACLEENSKTTDNN